MRVVALTELAVLIRGLRFTLSPEIVAVIDGVAAHAAHDKVPIDVTFDTRLRKRSSIPQLLEIEISASRLETECREQQYYNPEHEQTNLLEEVSEQCGNHKKYDDGDEPHVLTAPETAHVMHHEPMVFVSVGLAHCASLRLYHNML